MHHRMPIPLRSHVVVLVGIALLLAVLCPLRPADAAAATSAIDFRLTVRDFMSAQCMYDPLVYGKLIYEQYWYNSMNTPASYHRIFDSDATYCPIRQSIVDGVHSGHPDFEADSGNWGYGSD